MAQNRSAYTLVDNSNYLHRTSVGLGAVRYYGMGSEKPSARLRDDAEELYATATDFIRVHQFRDRNQTLRNGLTVAQAYTLDLLLRRDGWGLLELARELQLDKSTTSRIVAGMKRHRLLAWTRSPDDARSKIIVASAEGRRRYARFRAAIVSDNARLLAGFSDGDRKAALKMLRELAQRARQE